MTTERSRWGSACIGAAIGVGIGILWDIAQRHEGAPPVAMRAVIAGLVLFACCYGWWPWIARHPTHRLAGSFGLGLTVSLLALIVASADFVYVKYAPTEPDMLTLLGAVLGTAAISALFVAIPFIVASWVVALLWVRISFGSIRSRSPKDL